MSILASQVIDQALQRFDEDTADPIFVTRAELLQHLNDGFLELQLLAAQLTSERTYTLIGAKLQSVPDGAIAIMHVAYANKPIEKSSVENFDRENPNWDAQYGILHKWAPCGLDRWFVDRQPTAALNVTLTTLNQPTTLTETDAIDLEQEYVDGLTEYVYHMARFKESGAEFQQAQEQYDQFLNIAGLRQKQSFAEQFELWAHDPNADTGIGYSTLESN